MLQIGSLRSPKITISFGTNLITTFKSFKCFKFLTVFGNTGSASVSGDLAMAFFYIYLELGRGKMLPGGGAVNSV